MKLDAMTNLRRIRMERGMSIVDLAEKSGMSYKGLSKLDIGERSTSKADALTVYRLAQALSVSMEELLEL